MPFALDPPVVDFVREAMQALGLTCDELFDADRDWVSNPPAQISWAELAGVMGALKVAAGPGPGLSVLAPVAATRFVTPAFGGFEGLLRKPAALFTSRFGPACIGRFAVLDWNIEVVRGGWLRCRSWVRPEYESAIAGGGEISPALSSLFELLRALAIAFPTRFGLGTASVDEERDGLAQILTIVPPRSGDLWTRVRRASRVLFSDHSEPESEVAQSGSPNLALLRDHRAARRKGERERVRSEMLGRALDRAEEQSIVRALAFEALGHRIRTPLQGIVGGLDDLRDTAALGDEQRRLVDTLQSCTEELTAAIDDVLDISRAQESIGPVRLQACDFRTFLAELERHYSERAQRAQRVFKLQTSGELPGRLSCDLRRIRQIIDCFVDNALRHVESGAVRLIVKTRFLGDDGYEDVWNVDFAVQDEGAGMDFETRAGLFEASELPLMAGAGQARADSEERTAIGLCAARHIAAAMRGTISLEDGVEGGSSFVLRMKLAETGDELTVSRSGSGFALNCLPEKIMLIAGASDWRRRVVEMLSELGISVVQAAANEVAFELLARDEGIELVLVDGAESSPQRLELVMELRRRVGRLMPIVAVSVTGVSCGRARWRVSGVSHFLKMPTTRTRLETQLEYWMSGYDGDEQGEAWLAHDTSFFGSGSTSASMRRDGLAANSVPDDSEPRASVERYASGKTEELEVTSYTREPPENASVSSPAEVEMPAAPKLGRSKGEASEVRELPEGPQVLLVDDNGVNREVMSRMLRKFGCRVESVENGRIALEKATRIRFVAIFMDCEMPVMDGFDATRAIRGLPEPYASTPIIATTAYASDADRKACQQAGMNDFLVKPVTRDRLRICLDRWRNSIVNEGAGERAA